MTLGEVPAVRTVSTKEGLIGDDTVAVRVVAESPVVGGVPVLLIEGKA